MLRFCAFACIIHRLAQNLQRLIARVSQEQVLAGVSFAVAPILIVLDGSDSRQCLISREGTAVVNPALMISPLSAECAALVSLPVPASTTILALQARRSTRSRPSQIIHQFSQ